MTETTKHKIRETVKAYIDLYPFEYSAFLDQIRAKKANQLNKFAAVKNYREGTALERWNFDLPETLFDSFKAILTQTEWEEFSSLKGTRWFMRNFPQFTGPEKI